MISDAYKCPVPLCGMKTSTAAAMCRHIIYTHLRYEKHQEWIKSHGISYIQMCALKDGELHLNFKPLIEVIERECKTT